MFATRWGQFGTILSALPSHTRLSNHERHATRFDLSRFSPHAFVNYVYGMVRRPSVTIGPFRPFPLFAPRFRELCVWYGQKAIGDPSARSAPPPAAPRAPTAPCVQIAHDPEEAPL
jgi:hypothetical protein